MSHIVSIQTQLRDPAGISAACQRLGLAAPVHAKAQLYAGQTVEGLLVQLPGWRYPIAIDTQTGDIHHDNYGGAWGSQSDLDALIQADACEKAKLSEWASPTTQ